MKWFLALVPVAAAATLAACGASGPVDTSRGDGPPAPQPGEPRQPEDDPPTADALGGDAPPPAWIGSRRGSAWLAYGSYCWGDTCADMVSPACGDGHTPTVDVDPGEVVTFHLRFRAKTAVLDHFTDVGETDASVDQERLRPERDPEWRVSREGPLSLSTWVGDGRDASYTVCLRFASAPLSVDEALERSNGDVAVRGTLYADGDETRLCGGLAESYPPQCAQPSLLVVGAAVAAHDLRREGEVAWSEEPVTVAGTLEGSRLVVEP